MSNWARMLFLGDSLTYGSRDPYGLCWPFYMAHIAGLEDYTILPEVEAEPGRTSSQLVRMAIEKIVESEAKEVFILIGTNDAKDEVNLSPSLYLANVRLLVNTCKAFGRREYILTIPQPKGFGSVGYSTAITERIANYNEQLRHSGFRLVECSDLTGTVDGIHLDFDTECKIAERVWQAIKKERTFTSPAG